MIQVLPPPRPLRWTARRVSRFPTPLASTAPARLPAVSGAAHIALGLSSPVSGSASCRRHLGALTVALATPDLPIFQMWPSRDEKGVLFRHSLSRSPVPGTGIVGKLQPRAPAAYGQNLQRVGFDLTPGP